MTKTAIPAICLTMALISLVGANPIVREDTLRKIRESCVIAIDGSHAVVSCSVTYHKLRPLHEKLNIKVPVFVTSSADPESKELHSSIGMRLECEGSEAIFEGAGASSQGLPPLDPVPDDGKQEIYFYFEFQSPALDEFTVVATYEQPLIKDAVHYLPLFESNEIEGDPKDFTVTFFSLNNSELDLETTHKNRQKIMKSRITVIPAHNELIVVRTKKGGESASGK